MADSEPGGAPGVLPNEGAGAALRLSHTRRLGCLRPPGREPDKMGRGRCVRGGVFTPAERACVRPLLPSAGQTSGSGTGQAPRPGPYRFETETVPVRPNMQRFIGQDAKRGRSAGHGAISPSRLFPLLPPCWAAPSLLRYSLARERRCDRFRCSRYSRPSFYLARAAFNPSPPLLSTMHTHFAHAHAHAHAHVAHRPRSAGGAPRPRTAPSPQHPTQHTSKRGRERWRW